MPLLVDTLVPFGADGLVDGTALKAHLRRLLQAGIDGFAPAVSEMIHLDRRERERILDLVAEVADGRSVLFPVWDPSPAHALRLGRLCAERGFGALLPPPILERVGEDATVEWYRAIAEHVPRLHAWHDPRFDNPLSPRLLTRLVAETGVVGWMDASRDPHRLRRLAATWPGRTWVALGPGLTAGDLRALRELSGLAGAVSRVANAWPDLARAAWVDGDLAACEAIARRESAVEKLGGVVGLKELLRMGARLPLAPALASDLERLPPATLG